MKVIKEFPKDDDVMIAGLEATYYQDGDCMGEEEANELKIKTADGGGGTFYVIETERWAISSIDELKMLIEDFIKRYE